MNVSYSGARPAAGGSYLNAGTCTWALTDSDGAEVGSGALSYVALSDGNYLGTIDASVTGALVEDGAYDLVIEFAESGYEDYRKFAMRAAYRTAT